MKIPDAEGQILEALWLGQPLSQDEILARVGAAQGWAAGTVRSLIQRLIARKAIEGRRDASGYRYHPLIARDHFVRSESQGFLDRLFGGEVAPLVSHLAHHRALTAADLQKLRALIETLEKDHDQD